MLSQTLSFAEFEASDEAAKAAQVSSRRHCESLKHSACLLQIILLELLLSFWGWP